MNEQELIARRQSDCTRHPPPVNAWVLVGGHIVRGGVWQCPHCGVARSEYEATHVHWTPP